MAKVSPKEEFLITDPEKQPGVVLEIEAGTRPIQLLEPYSADHDVHCAFCPQKQLHRHGYLALLEDGRRALCGNVCAEEYFDKVTVGSLDRKRDQLAGARLKRTMAEAIISRSAELLPIIDDSVLPNEWAAEKFMIGIGQHLPPTVIESIKLSEVEGVSYLGQSCRAFGDARGGIASLLSKADGVTEGEAEALMAKRVAVTERIEHGTHYLQEAVMFLQTENLLKFSDWLLANQSQHMIGGVKVTKRHMILTVQVGVDWTGEPQKRSYHYELPEVEAPELSELMEISGWLPPTR